MMDIMKLILKYAIYVTAIALPVMDRINNHV
jgi:hypothetical protein